LINFCCEKSLKEVAIYEQDEIDYKLINPLSRLLAFSRKVGEEVIYYLSLVWFIWYVSL